MLNDDGNETGCPIPPSWKLMEILVVKAWNDLLEGLIQNSWKVCGYKIAEELETEEDSPVLNLANDRNYILTELDGIDGGKCSFNAQNPENDCESSNEVSEWVVQTKQRQSRKSKLLFKNGLLF